MVKLKKKPFKVELLLDIPSKSLESVLKCLRFLHVCGWLINNII